MCFFSAASQLHRLELNGGQDLLPNVVLKNFQNLITLLGHVNAIYCIIFDRTSTRLVTGSDDNNVKVWSTRDGSLLKTLRGHQNAISFLALNAKNTYLASASMDSTIRIWDFYTLCPVRVLMELGPINIVHFCPSTKNEFLMSGTATRVKLWPMDQITNPDIEVNTTPICPNFFFPFFVVSIN